MKSYCIVTLAIVAACSAASTYDPKHDSLDIATVLQDLKSLHEFVDCFNDKIECSPLTAEFKKDMPEAIQQACAKCTPAQKHIFKVFLEGFKQKLPAEYEVYKQKYDADNKYLPALQAAVANA